MSPAIRDRAQFDEIRADLETTPYLARRRELMDCGDLHEVVAEIVSGKLAREISDTRLPRRELRAILWATLRGDGPRGNARRAPRPEVSSRHVF